jgi:uncharacterized membrane protein YjdF
MAELLRRYCSNVSSDRPFRIISWTTTALLIGVSLFVARAGSTYKFAFLFLVPLLWLVYFFRKPLALHPAHYTLFASFLLFHDLGVFGSYRRSFFGLQFDVYVHFYFGFVAGFIVRCAFQVRFAWKGPWLAVSVALFILGIGAVHELVECGTTIVLGKEKGMLKLDPNDPYDTQKDLMNNLLGALLSTAVSSAMAKRSSARAFQIVPSAHPSAEQDTIAQGSSKGAC